MNNIKWFFMSKYKKLLYQIKCAETNEQRLHLSNGVILDFSKDDTTANATDPDLAYASIVTLSLRCCAKDGGCDMCPFSIFGPECGEILSRAAADLIEKTSSVSKI